MKEVLELCDAGHTPAAIAARLGLTPGKVYAILRRERPGRKRAPRRRVSEVPARVKGLAAAGVGAARIAELLGVSRQYVYAILAVSS